MFITKKNTYVCMGRGGKKSNSVFIIEFAPLREIRDFLSNTHHILSFSNFLNALFFCFFLTFHDFYFFQTNFIHGNLKMERKGFAGLEFFRILNCPNRVTRT